MTLQFSTSISRVSKCCGTALCGLFKTMKRDRICQATQEPNQKKYWKTYRTNAREHKNEMHFLFRVPKSHSLVETGGNSELELEESVETM